MFVSLQDSYVEAPTPSLTTFGDGASEEIIKVINEATMAEP